MGKIKIVLKVPNTTQTGNDYWTDTTYCTSVDVEVPDDVYNQLTDGTTIIGGHRIEADPAAQGDE